MLGGRTTDGRRRLGLPVARWARLALGLLVLFALVRSVTWASVQPAWLAPDEDYHFLYINYLVEEGAVPSLDRPFFTADLYRGAFLTGQGQYVYGPRTDYHGRPHDILPRLAGPRSERAPALPKPRPVLHPPLYHLGGALTDVILDGNISITRMTGIRYWSALLGAVTVLLVYLLAAQILAREWERLAAAALAATQPVLAFSASTITNDVAVAVVLTATLALLAALQRRPVRPRDGAALGLLLATGLLTKATMYALIPLIALGLLLAWRAHPVDRRAVARTAGWAAAVPAALAGWWYVRLMIDVGSPLGERGSLTGAPANTHGPGLAHVASIAWSWISTVYRGYWFNAASPDRPGTGTLWYWLPAAGIALAAAGTGTLVWRRRHRLRDPEEATLRQVALLIAAALLLLLPPLGLDVLRGARGLPFVTVQPRFLGPAFGGLAVLAVLAFRELAPRRAAWTVGAVCAVAAVAYAHTFIADVLERYYGPVAGHPLRLLLHASYDKPPFITQWSLLALVLVASVSLLAAALLTVAGSSPPGVGLRAVRIRRPSRSPARA